MEPQNWLGDLHLFVAVAHAKSFTRASVALEMPRSTVSRRISDLENAIGIRLLNRTTRRVELTEDGTIYLQRAERIVEEALVAHEDLCDRVDKLAGLLRVSMPASIAWRLAIPWMAEFTDTYPDIRLMVDTSPDHIDPVADKWDVCVHDSALRDSSFTTRRLALFRRSLFAAPAYAQKHGVPNHPDELREHSCICAGPTAERTNWTLTRGLERVSIAVSGRVACGNVEFSPLFALAGTGIAAAVTKAFAPHVEAGQLVPVLEGWQFEPLVISVIIPNRMVPAKTRVFLDFFVGKMKQIQNAIG